MFILSFVHSAAGETITLKSGKVFNGEIIEKTKDYIRVKYNGLEIYYENKYIKSIEDLKTDAPKVVPEAASPFNKGIELAAQGNFIQARQEFQKQLNDIKDGLSILDAVENGSISKEYAAYLFQGALHIVREEYQLAIKILEKAWEINPKDPDVNFNLGFAYYSLKEYEKSIAYLFVALKFQPVDTQAYELIARDYYSLGEYQKAKENLLIARKLLSKNEDGSGVAHIDELLQTVAIVTP